MIGKTLSHYEIISMLGKGGMGEVYRAKDQTLGRDVAIKVLPIEFAIDSGRVERFQREARLLASLNHPNIASIYGLEESGGSNFLVMELIEGDTLAERLKRGPIPIDEALNLALQIAEGLEAAHEKGVTHRDLKPANIKITPDGKVKVLDFGLAKAYDNDQDKANPQDSPTVSAAATRQGVILGTAAYMSPEQAAGKSVDKRADIWAFGVVLFEMLTGKKLFEGETVTETLAGVIKGEPEWSLLPPNLHPRIGLLLERCLEKKPKNRCSGISDARVDIQKVLTAPSGVFVKPVIMEEPRRKSRGMLLWVAATALSAVIVGLIIWNFKTSSRSVPLPITRFSYELPSDLAGFAASPNGRQFVYTTSRGLYLQSFDEIDPKFITGSEGGGRRPFFSPDGKWIGYFGTDFKLKKINISGGAPIDLCGVLVPTGARWNQDDKIIFGNGFSGIYRISANGGTPELLVKGIHYMSSQLLPDGKSVICTDESKRAVTIQVQPIQSGEKKDLFEAIAAYYLPTGHIVYALGNGPYNIFAVPFNLERLEATGGPVPIVNGILGFSISDSGTLLYLPSTADNFPTARHVAVWVDQKGKEKPIPDSPNNLVHNFTLSPDGTRVALESSTGGNSQIWIWDLRYKTMTQLTFDESVKMSPLWTRDGRQVLYQTNLSEGQYELNMKAADGTGSTQKIGSFPFIPIPYSWSGDGKSLVMLENDFNPLRGDITMLQIEGDQSRKPLLAEKYVETQPSISHDGRWIAYVSGEPGGTPNVYVRPFPDVEKGKWRISDTGGLAPLWSKDSKKIFYRNGDAVMAVEVETDPKFKNGKPEVLFRGNYYYWTLGKMMEAMWAIGPDDRFMMVKEVNPIGKASATEAPKQINIVLNWFEELKERVPVK